MNGMRVVEKHKDHRDSVSIEVKTSSVFYDLTTQWSG